MMRVPRLLVPAMIGLAACGGERADLASLRAQLLETDRAWAAAAEAGEDVERIVSFWADDAIVLPPGQPPIEGKAAIRDYVTAALAIPGFAVSWETTDATLGHSGDVGYLVGENRFTLPDESGGLVTKHGRAVTVWRRTAAGWKCVVDIWNDAPGETP